MKYLNLYKLNLINICIIFIRLFYILTYYNGLICINYKTNICNNIIYCYLN